MAHWLGYRYEEPLGLQGDLFQGATSNSFGHQTFLSRSDLMRLQQKAKSFASSHSFVVSEWLYRNKSHEYFNDILDQKDGIMEVYVKDNNGDQRSPINGRLKGLFFCASVDSAGQMLQPSPFGPRRLCISSTFMFGFAPNLYFADFYCTRSGRPHYATLVMTQRFSPADQFCQRYLIPLDIRNNGFLYVNYAEQRVYVTCSTSPNSRLLVEVLYTEDINVQALIDNKRAKIVYTMSTGLSTPGGLRKCSSCGICNL